MKTKQFKWLATTLLLVAAMVIPSTAWAQDVTYTNGFGSDGSYQEATLTTDKYDINGDNTIDNVYEIGNAGQLYWFAGLVNGDASVCTGDVSQNTSANAVLTANITVNKDVLNANGQPIVSAGDFIEWTPIVKYGGIFDGQGHTISGLLKTSDYCIGLFSINDGTIKNIGVVDSYLSGYDTVGGVCGWNQGSLTNCYNTGFVYGTQTVGGVCGWNLGGSLTNCYNTGYINGNNSVGGVCGVNDGDLTNCYNTGSISIYTESGENVGGVCGWHRGGNLTNCYYLSGTATGGIYGADVEGSAESKSSNQFASGEVAWLLNGKKSEGTTDNPLAWYQNINGDSYPVLDSRHGTVYRGYKCLELTYSNNQDELSEYPVHNYDNGICKTCNAYLPATQNKNGEYEIGNAGQLCWFAGLVNGTLTNGTQQNTSAKGVLTNDIDLASISNWTPIGNKSNKFGGTFDGKNFKVQHLTITQQGNYTGLFGYASGATMKNICIDGNVTLTTTSKTEGYGSIAGCMVKSTISNCHSSVNFTINTEMNASENCIGHIGGIVGEMNETSSTESYVSGCSYSGTINLGKNKVNVAAGIVGYAIYSGVPITNCSFTGTIKSECNDAIIIGGIFGYTNSGGNVTVTNCLQAGTLVKPGNTSLTGILIGQINNGYGANAVTKNYYTSSTFNVIGSTKETPTTTPATQCSTKQLQSGEICYLLNSSSSNGGWGQKLGTDSYPVPGSNKKVYYGYVDCKNMTYSNNPEELSENPVHHYDNGFGTCTVCGDKLNGYQPATLTTGKYDIDGDNTKDNVYEIGNAGQLYWFAGLVNGDPSVCTGGVSQNKSANAVLIANITVNKDVVDAYGDLKTGDFIEWTPIGNYNNEYGGAFDGQGHTISGLWKIQKDDYIGLFGVNNGTIKNIGVVDSYFSGNNDVGGVCGLNYYGSLTNCYNTGRIYGKQDAIEYENVGGVCGYNEGGSLTNCYNTGYIYGVNNVGGVCGWNGGSLTNCYNTGRIYGFEYVGGVCGWNYRSITNCYNTGSISGYNNYIGGVCGKNEDFLTNCYNTGYIEGNNYVGGVCGHNGRDLTNCYNTGYIHGYDNVGGVCGWHHAGSLTNCYYLANEDDKNGGKEETQFNNGEVAYLLAQGYTVEGTFYDGSVWGQQIGTNDYPLIGSPYKVLRAARDGQDGTNYWATFSNLNSNAELTASTGAITVYNATVSSGTLTLTKRSNKVSSGEGVLLKASSEYVNAKNISDEVSAATTGENDLLATPKDAGVLNDTNYKHYRLTYNDVDSKEGIGFYLGVVKDETGNVTSNDGSQIRVTPGKAYLKVSTQAATEPSTAKLARGFAFPGDGETTGIECITVTDESTGNNRVEGIFDLQGRKVSKPTKGVYINNGKKVIIK